VFVIIQSVLIIIIIIINKYYYIESILKEKHAEVLDKGDDDDDDDGDDGLADAIAAQRLADEKYTDTVFGHDGMKDVPLEVFIFFVLLLISNV
jgi:hypothetical protein